MANYLRAALVPCAMGLIATNLAAFALAAPAPAAESAGIPSCALGRLPAALRTALPDAVARERRRFERSLNDLTAADRERAGDAFATGVAAYVYGMPTVLLRLTVERFPRNQIIGVARLATPESRTVVAPNHDTLYSVSRLDLGDEPLVVTAPATAGRYSVLQLLDAHTNVVDYVGSGADRDAASSVAIVGPGWNGELPPDVRIVRSPTKLVWLLGRTLADGAGDVPAATLVMRGYGVTPLSDWSAGTRRTATIIDGLQNPQPEVRLPRGLAFYDALVAAMAEDPPLTRDACALRAFAAFGIAPGQSPQTAGDPVVARALRAAAPAGDRVVDVAVETTGSHSRRRNNGWWFTPGGTGRFGTGYAPRAAVARVGLGSNVPSEAVYPVTDVDSAGRPLSGRHDYVVSFPARGLPPVRAFWSLTIYDSSLFLAPNPLDRYALGDRSDGLRAGRGGSLTVYVQRRPPDKSRRSNWLPAPAGAFSLYLRLYEPQPAAIDGSWTPPTVTRVR